MFKRLFALLSVILLAVSCQDDELANVSTDLSFEVIPSTVNLVQYGVMMEGFDTQTLEYEGINAYLTLYYTNATAGDLVSITDVSDQTDISVQGDYSFNEDGHGVMNMSFKGTPTSYGVRSLDFQIECNGQTWLVEDVTFYVREYGAVLGDMEIVDVDFFAVIRQNLDFANDYSYVTVPGDSWDDDDKEDAAATADGKRQMIVYYTNGWSRTVSFAIAGDSGVVIDQTASYTLAEGSAMTGVIIPIDELSQYNGYEPSVTVTVNAVQTGSQISSYSFEEQTEAGEQLEMQVSFPYDLAEGTENEGKNLIFSYSNGERRDINIAVELSGASDGLYVSDNPVEYKLDVDDTQGYFTVAIEGTPSESGTLDISVTVSGDDIPTPLVYNMQAEVLAEAEPISISNMSFTGPIMSEYSDDYILSFDYTGGTKDCKVSLTKIVGTTFGISDSDLLNISDFVLSADGDGKAEFNLGNKLTHSYDAYHSEVKTSESFEISYNAVKVGSSHSASITVDGFVFEDNNYRAIKVGSDYWLNKNLGATSAVIATVEIQNNKISSWEHDINTYGEYYQRSRLGGISIMTDQVAAAAILAEAGETTTQFYPDTTTPFFMSANSNNKWSYGIWGNRISTYLPASLATESARETQISYWSVNGAYNPCPEGFRPPSSTEIISMIETLSGISVSARASANDKYVYSSANSVVVPALMNGVLGFPLAGRIEHNGPTQRASTDFKYGYGQSGMVGLYGNPSSNGVNPGVTTAANGEIYIFSADIDTDLTLTDATGGYVRAIKIDSGGTLEEINMIRNCTLPLRCIKD